MPATTPTNDSNLSIPENQSPVTSPHKASDARFDASFDPNTSDLSRKQSGITEYTRLLMFSAAEVVHTESVYISTGCDV